MTGCSFLIDPIILHVLIKMPWIYSSKLNFGSKNKPKCFCSWTWWTRLSLKFSDGYSFELVFRLNSNSWAYLLGSGLKFIFHCTSHSEIFFRSLFTLTVLVVISSLVENKELLSAKSFGLDCKPLGKSKTINVPKLIPVEHLHSPLSRMRAYHLKLLFAGDFSKSLLKDIAACLLSRFVLTYI